jgi:hypothetical protein
LLAGTDGSFFVLISLHLATKRLVPVARKQFCSDENLSWPGIIRRCFPRSLLLPQNVFVFFCLIGPLLLPPSSYALLFLCKMSSAIQLFWS